MNFYQLCDDFLQSLSQLIENRDSSSALEIDYLDGILKIVINNNKKTFIINRNAGNQKIWYSSPFSGADYFSYNQESKQWLNSSNLELSEKLMNELKSFINIK
jgi:iron donor protein CyaY